MYHNDTIISTLPFDKLQLHKLAKNLHFEILAFSLEKEAVFPEHTSHTDAHLAVLEGDLWLYKYGSSHRLKKHHHLSFPKAIKHWVKANKNLKFLIIR